MDSMQTGKQKVERPDQHCKVQVLAYPLSVRPYGAWEPVIDLLQAKMTVKNFIRGDKEKA